jgi:cysteine synthase
MVKRSTWWATAVGTAVGTGGWFLGIGKYVSPTHPGWALFWITLAATIITRIIVDEEIRHKTSRAQATQPSSAPRNPQL